MDLRPHPRDLSRSLQWSLCLCSVGGLILDKTVSDPNFAGMAVFTPVINGEVSASAASGGRRGLDQRVWGLCISQGSSRQENPAQRVQDLGWFWEPALEHGVLGLPSFGEGLMMAGLVP